MCIIPYVTSIMLLCLSLNKRSDRELGTFLHLNSNRILSWECNVNLLWLTLDG